MQNILMQSLFLIKDILIEFSNFFLYLLVAVIIFTIFKFVFLLIRYFIFKRLMNLILDQIYDEDTNNDSNSFKSDKEDERKKDLEVEKKKEQEQKIEILNNKETNIDKEKKIIGFAKDKILGFWTAKFFKGMADSLKFVDPKDLEKGYFQAMIKAERKKKDIIKNQGGRGV